MAHMRRASSLRNVVAKRNSINAPVNLNCLVRVYLLDGSSKVLQMFSHSTAKEVLIALKFNLDLSDISTFALFRVVGNNVRRVELNEVITDVMKDPTNSGQEVRLLFRSWISFKYGAFDHEVFQHGIRNKQPNTAMWLAFMEAVFMCMTGKFYLTEDEAVMLGCLKMQAESGDFNPAHHDLRVMKNRVSSRFPEPARSRMKSLLQQAATNPAAAVNAEELAVRVQALYARIAGKSKVEAQINYLESLRTWCPFYGSTLYEVQCQYDDNPLDPNSSPPVIGMNAWVGPLAIFLLTPTEPPVIMRHPYRRIIKWVTLPDKHIFTYWVIKPHVTLADLEEFQEQQRAKLRGTRGRGHSGDGDSDGGSDADGDGDDEGGQLGELDAQQFCDCVYLVTSQVKELDYLVKSYVEASTGTPPVLPGATDDLLPMKVAAFGRSSRAKTAASSNDDDDDHRGGNSDEEGGVHDDSSSDGDSSDGGNGGGRRAKKAAKTKKAAGGTVAPPIPTAETAQKPRVGRLSLFFSSLGGDGLGQTGSGIGGSGGDGGGEEHFGDDTAAVTNSWFRNMYKADAPTKKGGGGTHATGSGGGQHRRGSAVLADDAKPDEISVHNIPMGVKYAASMSELKRMAEESQFSDEEDEEGEDDDDDDDGDDDEDNGGGRRGKKAAGRRARGGDSDEDGDNDDEEDDDDDGSDNGQRTATRRIPGISSSNAFRRASKILFG